MKQIRQGFWKVFVTETKKLLRRPLFLCCTVVFPLFCCFFFTTLMKEGLPEQLPLGIVDEDHSATSRNIIRTLQSFQMPHSLPTYANATEARRDVQRGNIYGFYVIPKGTGRDAMAQRMPTVSFYTSYAYLVAGSLLYRDMRTLSELVSGAAARSVLYARGATERQAMAFLQPVVIDMHAVGNPWLNYSVYLTNIIVPGILGLFIFMVTVFSLGEELKHGTADELLARAGDSTWRAVLGKLFAQHLLFFLTGSLIVAWFYVFLNFPCAGGILPLWGVMWLFIMGCQGLGVFMFAMLPTLRLGLSFASLWGMISFSICGMSFPVMSMHPILQWAAWLFPLRHYYMLYVNSALHGGCLASAFPHLATLLIMVSLPLLFLPRLHTILTTYRYVP